VDRTRVIDGSRIKAGDVIVGVASSGLHSNGYSLARRILLEEGKRSLEAHVPELGCTLADELLKPTLIYPRAILDLASRVEVRGLAHITGGGIPGNLPRCIPDGLRAVVQTSRWSPPPIFQLIAAGGVEREEMFRTFNMGLGLCAIVPRDQAQAAHVVLESHQLQSWAIGEIVPGQGEATVELA
jgi:phosphoribosylformylglycinamidine cyclo-ligase